MENDHFSTETFNSLPPHEAKKMLKMRKVAMFEKKTAEKAVIKHYAIEVNVCKHNEKLWNKKRGLAE